MESRFSIGSALSGAFGTIGGNPLATLGIAFLIGVLPTQVVSYIFLGTGLRAANAVLTLFRSPGGVTLYLAVTAFSVFCAMLVQATLVRVTVAHMRQEQVSIGASLATSLSKILPLLGVTILLTLGVGLGFIVLVVPGVIGYIMWCVATPAVVAEDIGVFDAFARSRALTKGHRWKIFGLFLILLVILWIFSAIAGAILLSTGMMNGLATSLAAGSFPIGYLVFNAIVSTLTTAFFGALMAGLYVELRTAQEGPMIDSLAEVFA